MKTAILWFLFIVPMDQYQGPAPVIQPSPRFVTEVACQELAGKLDYKTMQSNSIAIHGTTNECGITKNCVIYNNDINFGIPKYRAWCEKAEVEVSK